MGRSKKDLKPDQIKMIKKLIEKGKNIKEIHTALSSKNNDENDSKKDSEKDSQNDTKKDSEDNTTEDSKKDSEEDFDMAENTLYAKITKDLGYRYDKEKKEWSFNKNNDKELQDSSSSNTQEDTEKFGKDGNTGGTSQEPISEQLAMYHITPKDTTSKKGKNSKPSQTSSSPNNQFVNSDLVSTVDEIYKLTHDTFLKVLELDKRLDSVSKRVTEIQKSDLPQKIRQHPQEFAKIFTSESEKTSLNLNVEVKTKILSLMRSRFGEKGTESKLINTALLLALYQCGERVDFKEPKE